MLGNFNMFESSLDQLPMAEDHWSAVSALGELNEFLGMKDGWTSTYPDTKSFTFMADGSRNSQSRLDRIYATNRVFETAHDWRIEPNGIPGTDHDIVSVQVAHEEAPLVGKGRWTIPQHVTRDKKFKKSLRETGIAALEEIVNLGETRDESKNAQLIYHEWKMKAITEAKQREKIIVPRLRRQMEDLQQEIKSVHNDTSLDEETKTDTSAGLKAKLRSLERQRHQNVQVKSATRNRIEGETVCRYWTQTNKEAKPRDMIYALKKPQPPNTPANAPIDYEKHSQKMANLGRDYHDTLQGIYPIVDPEVREEKTAEVLNKITAHRDRRTEGHASCSSV